jgi:ADP-heptose:LPS heptosyltransferase
MLNQKKEKILAIQFQYLGDTIFLTPALQIIKLNFPKAELHVLVPNEIIPILKSVNYIDRIWGTPRSRGKLNILDQLPVVLNLRKEKFDRIVDFGGNDRGALYSFLVGSKMRLGIINKPVKFLHKFCFNQKVLSDDLPVAYIDRYIHLLKFWKLNLSSMSVYPKIESNKKYLDEGKILLAGNSIICHISTSQPKKEWPLESWYHFYTLARSKNFKIIFTSGTSNREITLLQHLKILDKNIPVMPPVYNLELFISAISQASCVISGDTAPLHFASALGIKTLGLFGIHGSVLRASPNYHNANKIISYSCKCVGDLEHFETCESKLKCMLLISPNDVFLKFTSLMEGS